MRVQLKLWEGGDVNRRWHWSEPCWCGCDYREDKSLYGYFTGGFGKTITKLIGKGGFSFYFSTKDTRRFDAWLKSDKRDPRSTHD